MQYSKLFVLAALFACTSAIKVRDNSDPEGRNVSKQTWRD